MNLSNASSILKTRYIGQVREQLNNSKVLSAKIGRKANPDLHLGVCGEHGGDPASIHFFDEVGLDYVSCSPSRIPLAARSALARGVSATRHSPG